MALVNKRNQHTGSFNFSSKQGVKCQGGGGARYGVNDKNFPLNTEKRLPLNVNITPTFPQNNVTKAGSTAARLQKYNMLEYGQLDDSNKYESRADLATHKRGLGDSGGPGRTAEMEDGMVIKVDGTGGLKNTLNDHLNLHPYGGSTGNINANDENKDFVPTNSISGTDLKAIDLFFKKIWKL